MSGTNYLQLARAADLENLRRAWQRIYAKRAAGGFDGKTVEDFAKRAEKELFRLQEELLGGTYVPQPLLQVSVPKPHNPQEQRELGLPAVRDKVAQEAVRRVIEPLLDRHFLDCSYGYRAGKGPQKAVRRVCHILKHRRPAWLAALDIDEFFPSLDHGVLLDLLRTHQIEEPVCRLLLLWLKMGVVTRRGRWLDVHQGISQGGVISPLLANLYLHPLDVFLREQGLEHVRYADDLRVFFTTRVLAEKMYKQIAQFLSARLKLRLNSLPKPVAPVASGFVFLGIQFTPGKLLIDPAKWPFIQEKISSHLLKSSDPADLPATLGQLNEAVAGWKRFYGGLVEKSEMRNLQETLKKALIEKLARELSNKSRPTVTELEQALGYLELPTCTNRRDRENFRKELLASAKQEAHRLAEKNRSEESATKTVRKAKRRHIRQMNHISHLLINTPGLFLGKKGACLAVRQHRRLLYEIPLSRLEGITLLSQANSLSSDLITHCARENIPVIWISAHGKVEALVYSPCSTSAQVQLRQLEIAGNPRQAMELARAFVLGKIKNQTNLIKYFGKYEKRRNGRFQNSCNRFCEVSAKLVAEADNLAPSEDWPRLRGHLLSIEGRLATHYWDMVHLLLQEHVDFPGRIRQGATDLVNSLLNYGYAILFSKILQAIYRSGLNPYISFFHASRSREATLGFDIMEVFRAQVVDRVVIAALRRSSQLFHLDQEGRLTSDSRAILVRQVHNRLSAIEKFRGREMKLEEIILSQVRDLREHLEAKKIYRPYVGKW